MINNKTITTPETQTKLSITNVLDMLQKALDERKLQKPEDSYVASLHQKGLNKILEKIGEEATEVILAAKDAKDQSTKHDLVKESADLFFHTFVALSHLDIPIAEIFEALESRLGTSGHTEKAARSTTSQ
jgi:phosphoribosyl-ATP pyrophosphohydrolase